MVSALLFKETKCPKQAPLQCIFASFGLPELNQPALSNVATVYAIAKFLFLRHRKYPNHPPFK